MVALTCIWINPSGPFTEPLGSRDALASLQTCSSGEEVHTDDEEEAQIRASSAHE